MQAFSLKSKIILKFKSIDYLKENRILFFSPRSFENNILFPFATSYLYEKGFSSIATLKTKYWNRLLSLENNLLLFVSNI